MRQKKWNWLTDWQDFAFTLNYGTVTSVRSIKLNLVQSGSVLLDTAGGPEPTTHGAHSEGTKCLVSYFSPRLGCLMTSYVARKLNTGKTLVTPVLCILEDIRATDCFHLRQYSQCITWCIRYETFRRDRRVLPHYHQQTAENRRCIKSSASAFRCVRPQNSLSNDPTRHRTDRTSVSYFMTMDSELAYLRHQSKDRLWAQISKFSRCRSCTSQTDTSETGGSRAREDFHMGQTRLTYWHYELSCRSLDHRALPSENLLAWIIWRNTAWVVIKCCGRGQFIY